MSSRPVRTPLEQSVIAVGPVLAVGSAWLLSLPSDHDAAGVTQANVALAIAIITVGVAIVDWVAGVATSIAAALALNYFHTLPYHTVRITDRRDVYSVVLLAALGLGVSAITAWRVRRRVGAIRQDDARNAGRALELLMGKSDRRRRCGRRRSRLRRTTWV